MQYDLVGIFGAGLLTFATPCVLPLVPIYLSALIGTDIRQVSGVQRGQLLVRSLLFSVGFVLVFTGMGLTASSIGGFLATHKTSLMVAGAMIIFLFGLKFLGVIEIPWLNRTVQADDRRLQTRFGGLNAVVMGVVFAAGWSPCAGPVLASVLMYTSSTTSDPWTGAVYLATYGLGFALPLVLVAIFAEAGVRLLRRIGPHLAKVEKGIGAFLVVVAGSLVADLGPRPAQHQSSLDEVQRLVLDEQGVRQPAMVAFTAKDCAVCRRMQPLLGSITQECHGNKVWIRKVDISEPARRHLASRYRLVATPTFVLLDREGAEVARLVGEQTETALKQALSALRGEPCPGLELLPIDMPATGHCLGLGCPYFFGPREGNTTGKIPRIAGDRRGRGRGPNLDGHPAILQHLPSNTQGVDAILWRQPPSHFARAKFVPCLAVLGRGRSEDAVSIGIFVEYMTRAKARSLDDANQPRRLAHLRVRQSRHLRQDQRGLSAYFLGLASNFGLHMGQQNT